MARSRNVKEKRFTLTLIGEAIEILERIPRNIRGMVVSNLLVRAHRMGDLDLILGPGEEEEPHGTSFQEAPREEYPPPRLPRERGEPISEERSFVKRPRSEHPDSEALDFAASDHVSEPHREESREANGEGKDWLERLDRKISEIIKL